MRKILRFVLAMVFIIFIYSALFAVLMDYEGQNKNVEPVTAVYWVINTITAVGYGDIVFQSPIGRIFSALVGLSGIIILFSVVLPIVITPWFERLTKELPSSAPPGMSDHIIICGYNPLVETLVEKFFQQDVRFLVIERSEEVAKTIFKRYPTIWGDPSERDVLINANIHHARLLIANERDAANADIVLTVREISDIEVIALVEDLGRSRFLRYAGASRIISPKTLMGTFIARITSPPKKGIFPGAVPLFGGIQLVELPIHPGSSLIEKTISKSDLRRRTGANIVGIWQRGKFVPCPGPDEEIQIHSVLIAVGGIEQLTQLRGLTIGTRKVGPTIVIGYGDVGRRIVKVFFEEGLQPLVVDQRELEDTYFKHIMGDGTSETVLSEASVENAVAILVMLNNDSDVVFSTLVARNMNPDAFIVARANRVRSVEKIYRAGADYVASVPIVASHMLMKIAQAEEEDVAMIYEELEVMKFEVKKISSLAGKSLRKNNLPGRFGCTIVAIDRENEVITDIDPDTVILGGDDIKILGSPESIEEFSRVHRQRFNIWKV